MGGHFLHPVRSRPPPMTKVRKKRKLMNIEEHHKFATELAKNYLSTMQQIKNFNDGVIKGTFRPEQLNVTLELMIKEIQALVESYSNTSQ